MKEFYKSRNVSTSRANAVQRIGQSITTVTDNRPQALLQRKLQQAVNLRAQTVQKQTALCADKEISLRQNSTHKALLQNKAVTATNCREGKYTGVKVIQKKGVKAIMIETNEFFEDFIEETQDINDLRNKVASNIYNLYKPGNDSSQVFDDDSGRTKRKIVKATGKKKAKSSAQQAKEAAALDKAQRLRHWSETAVTSAKRIYLELVAVTSVADKNTENYANVRMGINTKTEPDAYVNGTEALEVKHVDSDDIHQVNKHIKKASKQLNKRRRNEATGEDIEQRTAFIKMDNPDNKFPFTDTEYKKLKGKKPPTKELKRKIKERVESHNSADEEITYLFTSQNPLIDDVMITV